MNHHKILRDLLVEIKDEQLNYQPQQNGICRCIFSKFEKENHNKPCFNHRNHLLIRIFRQLVKNWPLFSGSIEHPISDKKSKQSPEKQYEYHMSRNRLWKGTQGKLRLALVGFLIDELGKYKDDIHTFYIIYEGFSTAGNSDPLKYLYLTDADSAMEAVVDFRQHGYTNNIVSNGYFFNARNLHQDFKIDPKGFLLKTELTPTKINLVPL